MNRNHQKQFFHGFSISEVSNATQLPRVTIWRHATGKRQISAEYALIYSEKLGLPLYQLRPDLWPPEPVSEQI